MGHGKSWKMTKMIFPKNNKARNTQGRSQDFSKGGGGSLCVKHYRHGFFATEYYRLFS